MNNNYCKNLTERLIGMGYQVVPHTAYGFDVVYKMDLRLQKACVVNWFKYQNLTSDSAAKLEREILEALA